MATETGSMTRRADRRRRQAVHAVRLARRSRRSSPLAIDRAEGVYMYGVDGRRWLDFSSQLMGVNIGHGDKRVTDAIARQAEKLPYISPFHAFEGRAVLGKRLAGLWPGDIEKTFFTLGGRRGERERREDREGSSPDGRRCWLATAATTARRTRTMIADRRSAPLAERAAADARASCTCSTPTTARSAGSTTRRPRSRCWRRRSSWRGRRRSRRSSWSRSTGTNGILIPPDGYLQGVRELCTQLRHRDDRRRGDVRLGPDRRMVRGRPLERRARPHHHGQGADVVVRAARRGRARAARSRRTSRTTCSGAASPTTPIRWASPPRSPRSTCWRTTTWSGNAKRLDPVMRRASRGARREAPQRRPHAEHRVVRHHRARQEPRDDGAAVAVQHDERHDAAAEPVPDRQRARDVHPLVERHDEPAAVHHRGAARRRVRDHRPGARRSPTPRWRPERWRDRIGFIGLGIMGKPMARNLLAAGFAAHGALARARTRRGAGRRRSRQRPTGPAAVAAASDITITMLPDTTDVEQVLAGGGGRAGRRRTGVAGRST